MNPENYKNAIIFYRGLDTPTLIIEIHDNETYNFIRSRITGHNYNEK